MENNNICKVGYISDGTMFGGVGKFKAGNLIKAHHYAIDVPYGPEPLGVCVNCGYQKRFENYVPANTYARQGGTK